VTSAEWTGGIGDLSTEAFDCLQHSWCDGSAGILLLWDVLVGGGLVVIAGGDVVGQGRAGHRLEVIGRDAVEVTTHTAHDVLHCRRGERVNARLSVVQQFHFRDAGDEDVGSVLAHDEAVDGARQLYGLTVDCHTFRAEHDLDVLDTNID
jgi:hypothetical protein